jgi:carbon monoxide dehydrogenase subunit G
MLQDPEVISSIIPGSEQLEEIGENKYLSVLVVKVGPVNGRFEGQVELTDLNAPESYTMIMSGKGPAGHVDGTGNVRLEADGDTTIMHYTGDAKVGGKIAAVGQRLLDVAAKQLAKQSLNLLAKRIQERIAAGES